MIFSGGLRVRPRPRSFKISCKCLESSRIVFLVVRPRSWRVGVPVGVHAAPVERVSGHAEGLPLKAQPAIRSHRRPPTAPCGRPLPDPQGVVRRKRRLRPKGRTRGLMSLGSFVSWGNGTRRRRFLRRPPHVSSSQSSRAGGRGVERPKLGLAPTYEPPPRRGAHPDRARRRDRRRVRRGGYSGLQ